MSIILWQWIIIRKTDERRLKSAEICFLRIAGYTLLDSRINEEIVREIWSPQIVGFIKQHRRNWLLMHWQDKLWQGWREDCKITFYRKEKLWKTYETMEGFSFGISITDLNRPKTGKDDDIDANELHFSKSPSEWWWLVTWSWIFIRLLT